MKKIALQLLLAFTTIIAMAQNGSSHLPFMGIPLDGNFNSFVQKLKTKGFQLQEKHGSYVIMTGVFSGNNVELRVFSTPKSNIACGVSVVYPASDNYQFMYEKYSSIKQNLIRKYGQGVSEGTGIGWPLQNGDILLELESNPQYGLHRIKLLYSDQINQKKMQSESNDDL